LKEIWEKVLGVHPIGIKDNFFDLGGHSLLALRLFDEINKQFGHNLPLATLLERPTVTQLAELLREQDTQANWSSLVPIQTTGAGVPFFAVHQLGGHVLMYRDLAQQLQPLRPVYGLQALGLDGKSAPHSRVEEMAAHYIRELRRIQGEGPYLIGGFSSGGLLAFEMAQQLLAGGERVGLLALLDTGAPGFWDSRLGRSPRRLQFDNLVERVNLHRQRLSALSPNAKLPYLQTRASILYRWLVYKPEQTQLPDALLELQRLHSQATSNYTVQRYPGRITLFRARKQPTRIDDDPTLGWRELARDGVDVHEVPGSHGWILVDPNVRVLARKLSQCLEQAQVNSRT
jgi:thioesterase domain-containing protein/acyl carrier protein